MSVSVADVLGSGSPLLGTDARGAQGVQVGGNNIQVNVYAESRSVVWPHQVGSVPLLADCYQYRKRQSARLDEAMSTGTVVLTQVLSGLGGVGKTQVAVGYARRVWAQSGVELLVWVAASSRAAVQATYAQAATEIGQLPADDVERAAEWFLGWLQTTSRRWLVVLDDVADPADLRGLWPTGPSGHTVVTTRRRDAVLTDRGRRLIDIGLYTPAEAVAYLQDKLGQAGSDVMAEAAELAADLGYLPLALAQATTFIRDRGDTCAGYRRRLGDQRRRLSEILPEDALADDYRFTVAATWSISVNRANALAPVELARPVLQLLSVLDPNGVPFDVVASPAVRTLIAEERTSSGPDGRCLVDEQDCRDALRNLHRLNLISLDAAGGARAIRTHALVQRATLEGLSADSVAATVRAAADALLQVWPEIERDTELGRVLRDCSASLHERHSGVLWNSDRHGVLYRAGRSLGDCGLIDAAVGYWTKMTAQASAALGIDHPDTLATRHDLALWRGEAGDPAGAITALEQLLTDYLRVLGPDHPHTLNTRHNLADWRGWAGDPAGAAVAFEQLLTDRLRVLGPDHPHTLDTRNNLARCRGEAGDPVGAAAALEQLLTDRLRVLGPDHPHTLDTRHNLAYRRGEAGDPAGAATTLEQLLTDYLRVFGPDHPETLATRHNLARWQGWAGDPAGAAAAFEQLLVDRLRVLGPDHRWTLDARHNLARWRGEAGDPVGAATALEHLLTDYLRVLGPDHPDTLATHHQLAYWQGQASVHKKADNRG
jgi:NB-ARC domain/Tetratricopeptide repeat